MEQYSTFPTDSHYCIIDMIRFTLFFHPHAVLKYYLLQDINSITHNYSFSGTILDVGCGEKPYISLFPDASSYTGIDFKSYSKNNTYQGNKPDSYFTNDYEKTLVLPFSDNTFNHSVSFQVLEHHKNPQKMIQEMIRVTKKNGYILLSMPFMWGLHEEPHDYFRFTEFGLRELFNKKNIKVIIVKKQGSIFSAVTLLSVDTLIEFANKNKIFYGLCLVVYPFFLFGNYLSFFLDHIFRSNKVFLNYLILAQKIS